MAPTDTDVVTSFVGQGTVDPDGYMRVTGTKDEATVELAGRYVLTVYCAGEGSLAVEYRIGASTQETTVGCAAELTATVLEIELAEPGEVEMVVDLDPEDDVVAAFGYRVQREAGAG